MRISKSYNKIEFLKPTMLKEILYLYLDKYGGELLEDSGLAEQDLANMYTTIKLRRNTNDKLELCCAKERVPKTVLLDVLTDAFMESKGIDLD